ncbi:MAG: co-chaperone GroES [Christensenellaceae bacterium]|jgi:chaperonin GroES|nr:co-chaperone GroES [Christensenellaceae bacterium]
MKLKPLFDRIVIQHVEAAEATASGILLPTAAQEKSQTARIIAVGNGGIVDGKEIKIEVKPGDTILYSKYAGSEFKLDGVEYVIIKQSDILAIVED